MPITQEQIDDFIDRTSRKDSNLSESDRQIIQHMALTISRQGQAIYKLSRKLQDKELFVTVAKQAVVDSVVDQIPALLGKAVGADFDFETARVRITDMNKKISEAKDLHEGLSAILGLVTFFAPLV